MPGQKQGTGRAIKKKKKSGPPINPQPPAWSRRSDSLPGGPGGGACGVELHAFSAPFWLRQRANLVDSHYHPR